MTTGMIDKIPVVFAEKRDDMKALIFDMDGLLIGSERIVQRGWELSGNDIGIPHLGDHILNTLGTNRAARKEYFLKTFGDDFPYECFTELNGKYFWDIVEKEGIPLKKGALELLSFAKEKGYLLAVATSSSQQYAVKTLTNLGIWEYFDGAVFGDVVSKAKPDPEIFLKASEMIHVAPEECYALEDAPNGIRAAHGAGMKAIYIPDLLPMPEEIRPIVFREYENLAQVMELL